MNLSYLMNTLLEIIIIFKFDHLHILMSLARYMIVIHWTFSELY